MPFTVYQPALQPGFLRNANGIAWGRALGAVKDYFCDLAKVGVQQRWAGLAQEDALAFIGAERGIPRGIGQSAASYAAALINAWAVWELAGTPWGILLLLEILGYPTAYLVYANGNTFGPSSGVTFTVPPALVDGPPWSFAAGDGQNGGAPDWNGSFWNRVLLVFSPAPASWTNIVNPPDETTAPKLSEIQTLRMILRTFGAGHAAKLGIMVPTGTGQATFGWPRGNTYAADGSRWGPNMAEALNALVLPSTPNGFNYQATVAGTTAYLEPTWPTSLGATVTDGTVTWTCYAAVPARGPGIVRWSPGLSVGGPSVILPSIPNGITYRTPTAGTTGLIEPVWSMLNPVSDNGITWTPYGTTAQGSVTFPV